MPNNHKEITLEDLGLTPEELETVVKGAQRIFPAREDDGSLANVDIDSEPEPPTS